MNTDNRRHCCEITEQAIPLLDTLVMDIGLGILGAFATAKDFVSGLQDFNNSPLVVTHLRDWCDKAQASANTDSQRNAIRAVRCCLDDNPDPERVRQLVADALGEEHQQAA